MDRQDPPDPFPSAAGAATTTAPATTTATAQLIALGELGGLSDGAADRLLIQGDNPLHHIRTRLQVSVGETTTTIGELLAAQMHQVFVLDRSVDQPVDLLLEGRVVARGQLVAVDDRFAIRITELPVALNT